MQRHTPASVLRLNNERAPRRSPQLTFLWGFGGGTITSLLFQDPKRGPLAFFVNNDIALIWTLCWWLVAYSPGGLSELSDPGWVSRSSFVAAAAYFLAAHALRLVEPAAAAGLLVTALVVQSLLTEPLGRPLDFTQPIADAFHAISFVPKPSSAAIVVGAARPAPGPAATFTTTPAISSPPGTPSKSRGVVRRAAGASGAAGGAAAWEETPAATPDECHPCDAALVAAGGGLCGDVLTLRGGLHLQPFKGTPALGRHAAGVSIIRPDGQQPGVGARLGPGRFRDPGG
ncbi:hypothetical protein MNEG_10090 [Monoraphidium neglectum]|uniref:Uncharacterized protein n=1 Tax=Monoraphidium neglectum TaxID=145388 RepID=A0A0D2MA90_9CHLO|nr:hypothetical protein MNEG_10090 [Monoraphidium neglectum]KIY97871.1 hypothetical protein MNEG_10090 [Monoraphidium neglectum]|eukprot:XP_013896891.1 hypothetical protein MNEG_10090 [Monoraphidium neglectum]